MKALLYIVSDKVQKSNICSKKKDSEEVYCLFFANFFRFIVSFHQLYLA